MRRLLFSLLVLGLLGAPAAYARPAKGHHHRRHKAPAAAVTRSEVLALIKQYAPGAVAGAAGQGGATGPAGHGGATGPTGPAGPTPPFSAGSGLVLSGTQLSLNPASTLFQDPLVSAQCPAYTFLYRVAQNGGTSCDFGAVAFTGQVTYIEIEAEQTPVTSTTAWTTGSDLITAQISIEGVGWATSNDEIDCGLWQGPTEVYGAGGALLTHIELANPQLDLALTTVRTGVSAGTVFTVKCVRAGGTEPAAATMGTLAVLPFSG
jgi:hypothetical protein